MSSYEEGKSNLYQLFFKSKERGITDEQVDLAKRLVQYGQSQPNKYTLLDFAQLVQKNEHNYTKLNNALGLILQYITDLLPPDLPPNWWSISTRNRSYVFRIGKTVMAEDVLQLAGYTKQTKDFLSFPEGNKAVLDKERLAKLACEVLLAREECSAAADGKITISFDGPLISSSYGMQPSGSGREHYHALATGRGHIDPQYNRPDQYENVSFVDSISSQPVGSLHVVSSNQGENFDFPDKTPETTPTTSKRPIPKPRTKSFAKRQSDSSIDSSPSNSQQFSGEVHVSEEDSIMTPSDIDKLSIDSSSDSLSASVRRRKLREKLDKYKNRKLNNTKPLSNPDIADSTTPSEPTNIRPSSSGGTRSSMTTLIPLTSSVPKVDEEPIPEEPVTPTKCPKCNGHLNENSICTYCTPQPTPSSRPVPKKRTKIQTQPILLASNPVNPPPVGGNPVVLPVNDIPVIQPSNFGPTANSNPVDTVLPAVNLNPLQTATPSHALHPLAPSNTHMNMLGSKTYGFSPVQSYINEPDPSMETLKNTSKEHNKDTEMEGDTLTDSPMDLIQGENAAVIPCKVYDEQYEKYQKEADYFKNLSLRDQDSHLDDKIRNNLTVNHLKVHYKGQNWFYRKEAHEVVIFQTLSYGKQKEMIREKRERGEKISHLVPYLQMLDEKVIDIDMEKRSQKIERANNEGKAFFEWVKVCCQHGFTPKEVEIALPQENPLVYLKGEWQSMINRTMTMVQHGQGDPGKPSYEEARQCLIDAKGSTISAGDICRKKRLEKIQHLEQKLAGKIEVERSVLAEHLTQCNLDIEETYYAVQRRTLVELYNYLNSVKDTSEENAAMLEEESKDKTRTDMDIMKESVLARTKDPEKDKKSYDSCVRMLIAENRFEDGCKAVMLIDLLKEKPDYPMRCYIEAVKYNATYEAAKNCLDQPCPLCTDNFIRDDMVTMPACGESLCKECFIGNFNIVIKEQSIKHFNCPICSKPDLSNEVDDMNIELFVAMVKEFCDKDVYELCQQKLLDFNLSKQSNFVWCINEECRSGFLTDRLDRIRVECPNCHKDMCFLCKKKWEPQHEGVTCDQFTQWKIDNDPEAQKQGLAAHLEEHGIQCPGCKFRYDLARGGCMHFKCTQCPVEFCSGCGGTIKTGEVCGRYDACKKLGLHAHHPRDCLFYLRDFSVKELQQLLANNDVHFDTDPPKAQLDAAAPDGGLEEKKHDDDDGDGDGDGSDNDTDDDTNDEIAVMAAPKLTCCVMLQKEGPDGLYDEKCGDPTKDNMAGLCQTHYKEYLVGKINKAKLDPLELYQLHQVVRILERDEKDVPERNDDDEEKETDEEYRLRLIEHIKKEIPLQRETTLNFVPTK